MHRLGYHSLFHDDARLDADYDNYHVSGSVYHGRIQDREQWVARTPGDLQKLVIQVHLTLTVTW